MIERGCVLALACLLSGCAALVYQIVWTRQVGLVMGNSVEAVATVVATFMAGLAAGNAVAARLVDRRPGLARLYAGLEAGIAVLALLVPVWLHAAQPLLARAYAPERPDGALGLPRFALAVVALLPPTLLMGATLPALVALAAPAAGRVGATAGGLYAWNTLGAVVGSLGSALVLLPRLGLRGSTWLAAALNLGAGALVLARRGPSTAAPGAAAVNAGAAAVDGAQPAAGAGRRSKKARPRGSAAATVDEAPLPVALVLAAAAVAGFAGLANEVAWTRALILLIGPTAYAFAFILTAVVAGLALGSALASALVPRLRRPARAAGGLLLLAAFLGVGVVQLIGTSVLDVGEFVRANADRMDRLLRAELLFTLALLAPPMAASGAVFPLLVRLVAERVPGAARPTGLLLAGNTLGAILGSLAAGFALLPALGLERTLLAVALLQAAAGSLLLLVPRPSARLGALPATALVVLGVAASRRAPWDAELLSGGVYKYAAYARAAGVEDTIRAGELLSYREGRAATVSVKRLGGTLSLAVDGKVDATSSGDMLTQRLLAHLPLLLHPSPRDALVIGLGSGVTAGSALSHPLGRVDTVEISAEVAFAAGRFFADVNHAALADPRLRLILGDGRNHVQLTDRGYDVIISEPSNPWMAGVSALFTRDFFRTARRCLNPGGLFCQWAHVYNMSEPDLKTVAAGFADAFPGAMLFLINEGDVLLIGGPPEGASFDPELLARRMREGRVRQDLDDVGLTSLFGFASLLTLGPAQLAAYVEGAERHTDDRPLLEFRAPRDIHANTGRDNALRLVALGGRGAPPEPWARLIRSPTPEELVERARMLERSEGFALAAEVYERASRMEPSLAALEGLARCALRLSRAAEAEQELRGLARERSPVDARVALALLLDNLGRSQEALTELEAALAKDGRHRRALLLAAEIQEQLGRPDAVARLARQALAAGSGDAEAEAYLASASLAAGELATALAQAESVLQRAPREARALEVAAIARAQQGDRVGARALFERLVRAEPDSWGHLNNYAIFELEGGDYDAAARRFEAALDLNPRSEASARGLLEAARALGDLRRLARADRALQAVSP